MEQDTQDKVTPPSKASVWSVLGVLLGVFIFQLWFLGFWPGNHPLDNASLSNPYTEALAKGQSYLLQQPDQRVLSAPDPFASSTRALLVWDASYFHGHYYMYFGIVPFVVFMVPFYLLTGSAPGPSLAILIFLMVGFAAYGCTLFQIRNTWLRRCSPFFLANAFLGFILSCGALSLMARPAIYEIENAAAFCFFGLGLLMLVMAEVRPPRKPAYAGLAALFVALTMGCRPNYFPAVAIFLLLAGILGFPPSRASLSSSTARRLIGPCFNNIGSRLMPRLLELPSGSVVPSILV